MNRPSSGWWLLLASLLTLAPHSAIHLPIWLTVCCVMVLAWRGWLLHNGRAMPPAWLTLVLAVSVAIAIRLHFGHFFGKEPGMALLAALLCLKQLEVRTPRDIRAGVLLALFLQLGLFLYNQSLPVAALAVLGTLLAIIALLDLQPASGATPGDRIRLGGVLMLQALPFMLLLFLLFPRIPGPLWGLPSDAYSATSGLSDSMAPGSISQLGLSEAIAFRAAFDTALPPASERYWRGPVLTDFDGRSWRAAPFSTETEAPWQSTGPVFNYTITLEPHNQRWLLALEHPVSVDAPARFSSDQQLLASEPIRQRIRLTIASSPFAQTGLNEHPDTLMRALQLPAGSNPRTRTTGAAIGREAATAEAALEAALDHMRSLPLAYTLRPPLLGTHTADEFLYDSQSGFCEHFASAFTVLMRAAGVPTRVVTGYQGGEINPVDGTLVVRQSDAHAWTEVWLPAQGWQRVDPTALAAPARIELGLASALPQGDPLPLLARPALSWLREARHQWEALSNRWNQVVIGFDRDRQSRLLQSLGMNTSDWKSFAVWLGVSVTLLMTALLYWAMRESRQRDPLDRAWQNVCRRLAKCGCTRLPWEGPMDYAERAATALPHHAASIRSLARSYAALRYGATGANHDSLVREFSARARRHRFR